MIFVIALVLAYLFNLYVIIWGKKDLETLKSKISVKKYLTEVDQSLSAAVGEKGSTGVKLGLVILSVFFVIFNAFSFLQCLVGVVVGTFAAKKSYQMPQISNVLNKVAVYINRLRK